MSSFLKHKYILCTSVKKCVYIQRYNINNVLVSVFFCFVFVFHSALAGKFLKVYVASKIVKLIMCIYIPLGVPTIKAMLIHLQL